MVNFRFSELTFSPNVDEPPYMTIAINKLLKEGYSISKSDLSDLSPYITKHIKRFGDYYINVNLIPVPIQNRLFANLFNK